MMSLFNDEYKGIRTVLQKIIENKWVPAGSGNFSLIDHKHIFADTYLYHNQSIRLKKKLTYLANSSIVISASGISFEEIRDNFSDLTLMVNINKNGDEIKLSGSSKFNHLQISSEYLSHLYLLNHFKKIKSDNTVLIHVHIPEFIAITHHLSYKSSNSLTHLIWSMFPEVKNVLPNGICYVPYQKSGSEQLAESTIKNYFNQELTVWEKHGVVAAGKSLEKAFNVLEMATEALKIFFLCRNAAYYPEDIIF